MCNLKANAALLCARLFRKSEFIMLLNLSNEVILTLAGRTHWVDCAMFILPGKIRLQSGSQSSWWWMSYFASLSFPCSSVLPSSQSKVMHVWQWWKGSRHKTENKHFACRWTNETLYGKITINIVVGHTKTDQYFILSHSALGALSSSQPSFWRQFSLIFPPVKRYLRLQYDNRYTVCSCSECAPEWALSHWKWSQLLLNSGIVVNFLQGVFSLWLFVCGGWVPIRSC